MFRKIMAMAVLMSFCAMAQDVFMGDYKGTLKDAEGKESALCAQVWATGKGGYQAVFTETIYEAPKPKVLLKLDGKVDGDKVVFNDGGATIANGVFAGNIALGAINMKSFKLVSPTLGLQPPEGAVVLMGPGKRMSQWRNAERAAGIVDLNRRLARANNCVGYLSNTIVSDKEQSVIMRSGSDDGLVVFLNGQKVYEKNVPRSLATDEDTIKLNLKQGEARRERAAIEGFAGRRRLAGPRPHLRRGRQCRSGNLLQASSAGTCHGQERRDHGVEHRRPVHRAGQRRFCGHERGVRS